VPESPVSSVYEIAVQAVTDVISASPVPEDPIHAENTVEWVVSLFPEADDMLLVAALGHDIERAVRPRRVNKSDYASFDDFKAAHALNSADILADLLDTLDIKEDFIRETHRLVKLHETGGDDRSDLLKDADSLSFFQVNLPFYLQRNGIARTIFRAKWGYRRLSPAYREKIHSFQYEDPRIDRLLRDITGI
jgi:hypothetical protein